MQANSQRIAQAFQGDRMNARIAKMGTYVLAASLTVGAASGIAFAQDGTKQDMRNAGHDTKNAAVDTGHGIKTGTKKAYHKTKHGVKKAYHKTKKTLDPHANSQDPHHQ
jgi:hypothetical protein